MLLNKLSTLADELFVKFDFHRIFVDHFNTFRNLTTQKLQWFVIIILFFVPLVFSFYISSLSLNLAGFVDVLGNVYSIFCGLLFNLLVLMKNEYKEAVNTPPQKQLVNQTYSNISFCISISLLGLLSLAIREIPIDKISSFDCFNSLCEISVNALTLYLFVVFIINLCMVMKRIYKICKP
jgi:hypothetical protein